MTECPSRFSLVQWHAGDLKTSEQETLSTHVAHCPNCTRTLQQLTQNEATWRADTETHTARLSQALHRAVRPPDTGHRFRPVVFATAAILLLSLCTGLWLLSTGDPHTPTELTYRGTLGYRIAVHRGDAVFDLTDNNALRTGDRLRLSITTAISGYLCVLLVTSPADIRTLSTAFDNADATGQVSIPTTGDHDLFGDAEIEPSLDEGHIVLLFSPRKIDLDLVRQHMPSILRQQTPPVLNTVVIAMEEIARIP